MADFSLGAECSSPFRPFISISRGNIDSPFDLYGTVPLPRCRTHPLREAARESHRQNPRIGAVYASLAGGAATVLIPLALRRRPADQRALDRVNRKFSCCPVGNINISSTVESDFVRAAPTKTGSRTRDPVVLQHDTSPVV